MHKELEKDRFILYIDIFTSVPTFSLGLHFLSQHMLVKEQLLFNVSLRYENLYLCFLAVLIHFMTSGLDMLSVSLAFPVRHETNDYIFISCHIPVLLCGYLSHYITQTKAFI